MHNTINYKRCQNRQFKYYDNYVFKYQNKTQDMQIIKALDKISKSNITNIKQMLCNHFNRKLKRNYKIPKKKWKILNSNRFQFKLNKPK